METVSIETMRQLLTTWESEGPYPENDCVLRWMERANQKRVERGQKLIALPDRGKLMVPVGKYIRGQAFFPGGDGLWRVDGMHTLVPGAQEGQIAKHGVMFIGNDFGSVTTQLASVARGYEEFTVKTWHFLRQRIVRTSIPAQMLFFTNAVMGLRRTGSNIDDIGWESVDPNTKPSERFFVRCARFLLQQVQLLEPRIVVVLGGKQQEVVQEAFSRLRPRPFVLLNRDHPFSDLYKSSIAREAIWREESAAIQSAWEQANG